MDAPDAPTLTEKTTPGPGVEVFIESIDSDAVTATAWRVADGVREEVRGAKRVAVSGDFLATDWEVPFGVESTYVVEIFDEDGASILGASAAITVTSDEVWISSQVDAGMVFTVVLEAASFAEVSRTRRVEQVFVPGLSRPFEQNWGLGGISGLPFTVYTDTVEQALSLQELLQSSPLLIRTPPSFTTLPRLLSASIKQPISNPLDQQYGGNAIVWTLTVDEVQPVNKAILRPLVTWGDWEDAFPADDYTWGDVLAIYGAGTWTDAMRNPPNA